MIRYDVEAYMYDENDVNKGWYIFTYDNASDIIKKLKNAFKWPLCKRLHIKIVAIQNDNEIYTKEADIFFDWTIDIVVRKFFNIK